MTAYSRLICSLALGPFLALSGPVAFSQEPTAIEFFEGRLAPLLANHCLGCHNPSDRKGGLDLTSAKGALAGGDSGPAIVPGDTDASLVWQKLVDDEMPPGSKPAEIKSPTAERTQARKLTADEKEIVRQWIARGAAWGAGPIDPLRYTTEHRAGHDWWSLRPIAPTAPPAVDDALWSASPIDAFVWVRLQRAGLGPSPPADRRTMIRRLAFDLIGLPPAPEEVEDFVHDPSPRAYENLVDRYLDSPHYGERWARHWLDVARYGESQGFERDKLRPNSWPYRDWVIAAMNDDMPYDEFVRWQLAGDALRPGDPLARIATGFLVAGPWDEVGQTQQSAAMRAVVRQDELEDLVGTTAQTFLALTANCARCHDHKFDPVSQRDYYRLSAALAGVRQGDRESLVGDEGAALAPRRAALEPPLAELRGRLAAIDLPARQRILTDWSREIPHLVVPVPIARWDFTTGLEDQLGALNATLHGGAVLDAAGLRLDGVGAYAGTPPMARDLKEKTLEAWVSLSKLDQGGGGVIGVQTLDGISFDSIVYGEREPRRWLAGSNGFARTKDVGGDEEADAVVRRVHVAVVYAPDQTIRVYRDGLPYGQTYEAALNTFEAGKCEVVFGLRHLPLGGNKLLSGTIARAQLYDRALTADEVAASAGVPSQTVTLDEILACLQPAERAARRQLSLEISRLEIQRRLLSGGPVYAVTPQEPEICHLLRRGDPRQPADEIAPGGVASVASAKADFGLAVDAPEAERRAKLAEWITAPENPLTARVIANRLWHHHFGVGIVDTPNDFGFNGGRPSHPELLDWLAAELMRQKWSLKQLHRAIVCSATYRQAAQARDEALRLDAGNRLLWRKGPTRLEAEALRDAVLAVAGQLNPTMGGPGYQDFRTFTFNSQFYDVFDPEGYAYQRRSIYRTIIRSGTSPLLDVLDCPDPSTTAPLRSVTTTPLQALALLNDSFLLRMADHFAERLREEAGSDLSAQINLACRLAYARPAGDIELAEFRQFAAEHGLAALGRVIFNGNEFLYVD